MTTTPYRRTTIAAMVAGLALTVLATLAVYVDRASTHLLAEHIQAGYPTYSQSEIEGAVTTYLVLLSIVGALGLVGWMATIWAVRRGKRWARPLATALLFLGVTVGLTGLLITDTSGETGLPPALGWVGLLPAAAGIAAVATMWRRPQPS